MQEYLWFEMNELDTLLCLFVITDYHEDGLPDEELEMTDHSDTDTEESEPEENDIILKDKKRKRNKYLDDEADVEDHEVNGSE